MGQNLNPGRLVIKSDPKGVTWDRLGVTDRLNHGVPTLPEYTEEYKYEPTIEYTFAWEGMLLAAGGQSSRFED